MSTDTATHDHDAHADEHGDHDHGLTDAGHVKNPILLALFTFRSFSS